MLWVLFLKHRKVMNPLNVEHIYDSSLVYSKILKVFFVNMAAIFLRKLQYSGMNEYNSVAAH